MSDLLPGEVVEVGPLHVPQTVDRKAAKRELENFHAWLMAEQVVTGIESPVTVELTSEELEDIEFGAYADHLREPEALRVGVVKPAAAAFALDKVAFGAVAWAPEGGRIWSAAVRSDGASGLRVHFDNFWLPPDTELYLFNENGMVAGPYSGAGPFNSGEFWSQMVTGETVYLQLRQYGPTKAGRLRQTYFDIVDVGHVGRRMDAQLESLCSYNASCVENAECVSDPAVYVARDAVAHMQYVKRPYVYACSGGLLNNTSGDGTLYFLTANHCISRNREAQTLETYFHWTVPCNGTCPDPFEPGVAPSTLGSTVVATDRTGDFSLLRLKGNLPGGVAFLGWTTDVVAFNYGLMLYRISHSAAAPQAYSEHSVDASFRPCNSWPRGPWIYSRDMFGATQGGSSGSPVVNSDGFVVGQLSGSCGFNINDDCDYVSNRTVDGAFADYYSQVAPWLDPLSPCDDADGDGYDDEACGGTDCDDNAFFVNPGAAEDCDDGIDNNCDGTVDEGCGACLPVGDACAANSDCCSGRCHPRKLICK
jgi:hypothetical protein